MENLIYALIGILVIGIMVKQISTEKETIHSTSVSNKNSYSHFKKSMTFVRDNGEKVTGYFASNHTILDNLKAAVIQIDRNLPHIINLEFSGEHGNMGYGFLRKDIIFTLYTRELPHGVVVQNTSVLPKEFKNTRKTKFVTHGWLSSGDAQICQMIKNEFLNKFDMNVFVIDWSTIADIYIYPIPAAATRVVAIFYADFVNDLIAKEGVKHDDIHLIGHSLGAHVSGFTGRRIKNGKVSRITGLDPALPFFDMLPDDHLNKDDSNFVDIIHTCAGFLGIKEPIGHVDFYPNGGGPPQPGCDSDWESLESCSHGKSYHLFAESILLDEPYAALIKHDIHGCLHVPMGYHTPENIRGVFYLDTN